MIPKNKEKPVPSETAEHKIIAAYFRKVGLGGCAVAFHVRNERPGAWQRLNAYKMGVYAGLPDWEIVDEGRALFLELKPRGWKSRKAKSGKYTQHEQRQLETHNALKLAGASVEIVETLDEVLETLARLGVPLRTESRATEAIRKGLSKFESASGQNNVS